ncbi:MAG: hypothetical protein ACC707_08380 [Thiohalomonadales bacterium]
MISTRMEQQKDWVVERILALDEGQQGLLLDKLRSIKKSPFHYRGLSMIAYIDELTRDIEKIQDDRYKDLHEHISDRLLKKYNVLLQSIQLAKNGYYSKKNDKRRLLKVEESKKKQYQYKH